MRRICLGFLLGVAVGAGSTPAQEQTNPLVTTIPDPFATRGGAGLGLGSGSIFEGDIFGTEIGAARPSIGEGSLFALLPDAPNGWTRKPSGKDAVANPTVTWADYARGEAAIRVRLRAGSPEAEGLKAGLTNDTLGAALGTRTSPRGHAYRDVASGGLRTVLADGTTVDVSGSGSRADKLVFLDLFPVSDR
ncbi:MAG: hypothetical protein ACFBSD_11725 [Paracoccaceae bacterium]